MSMADTTITLLNAGDSIVFKAAASPTDAFHKFTDSSDDLDQTDNFVQKATTTDATVTTLHTLTLSDNTAIYIEAKVIAMESDGSDRGIHHISGLFYRDGGNATQEGATVSLNTTESDAATDVAFVISTNDVLLRVTGIAAETWNWTGVVSVVHVN